MISFHLEVKSGGAGNCHLLVCTAGRCMNCVYDQLFGVLPFVLAISSTIYKFLNFEIEKSLFLWLTTRI